MSVESNLYIFNESESFDEIHGVALSDPSLPLKFYADRKAVATMQDQVYAVSVGALLTIWVIDGVICQMLAVAPAFFISSAFISFLLLMISRDYRAVQKDSGSSSAVLEITKDFLTWRTYTGQRIVTFPWSLVETVGASNDRRYSMLSFEFTDSELLIQYAADAKHREHLIKKLKMYDGRLQVSTFGLPLSADELEDVLRLRLAASTALRASRAADSAVRNSTSSPF